jgi:hypothetical protein
MDNNSNNRLIGNQNQNPNRNNNNNENVGQTISRQLREIREEIEQISRKLVNFGPFKGT